MEVLVPNPPNPVDAPKPVVPVPPNSVDCVVAAGVPPNNG